VLDPKGEDLGQAGAKAGSASSFAAWLTEMGRASFPLVDPERYTALKAEARAVAARKNLGAVLAGLRGKAEKETGQAQVEACDLLAKLLEYARFQRERADALRETAPPDALEAYKALALQFKGDEVARLAEATRLELEKDPKFQRELKAGAILRTMRETGAQIRRDRPLDASVNRTPVATLRSLLQALDKNFSDTKVFAQAKKLIADLGL